MLPLSIQQPYFSQDALAKPEFSLSDLKHAIVMESQTYGQLNNITL